MKQRILNISLAALLIIASAAGCTKPPIPSPGSSDMPQMTGGMSSESAQSTLPSETASTSATESHTTGKTGSTTHAATIKQPSGSTKKPDTSKTAGNSQPTAPATKPAVKLPLEVEWVTKPSLDYEYVEPTYDGKNWVAKKEKADQNCYDLIDDKGRVLYSFDYTGSPHPMMNPDIPDRIVINRQHPDSYSTEYALLDTSGNLIIPYQKEEICFYGDGLFMLEKGPEYNYIQVDKNGKKIGDYTGDMGYGGPGEHAFVYEIQTGTLYNTWGAWDNQYEMLQEEDDTPDRLVAWIGETVKDKDEYCCAQAAKVSNRFFAMSSVRNRMIGVQMYKYRIEGFLHWGYNFYNSALSKRSLDPYRVTDGDGAFPSGDAFTVYPGKDGKPEDSIRGEVFYMALQDMRALELLESMTSREHVMDILEEGLEKPLSFSEYPRSASYLLEMHEKVNREIDICAAAGI